ncbi:MAG: hypothetical protein WAM14_25585 [Candidatus Nitrosopolaris sp.]
MASFLFLLVMLLNKSWRDYNDSLIERGRILIDVFFLKSSNKEIKKMNNGKLEHHFSILIVMSVLGEDLFSKFLCT